MRRCSLTLTLSVFLALPLLGLCPSENLAQIKGTPAVPFLVSPAAIQLDNPEATEQILVRSRESPVDLTRSANYEIADPNIATVDAAGLVQAKGEGKTLILIRQGAQRVTVPVVVSGIVKPAPVHFETQVMPILSRLHCNSGGCHGKAEGQNGFKLSVFGHNPAGDHEALVMEGRGRRTFPASPDSSLLLLKATGQIAHGGGRRLDEGSLFHRRLRRWIAEGARFHPHEPAAQARDPLLTLQTPEGGSIVKIEVEPGESKVILTFGGTQQLRVLAIDADGKRHHVTQTAQFESNAGTVAAVDARGWISAGSTPGQAAILVRYLDHVAICRVVVPRTGMRFTRPPEANFIDRLAWDNLGQLGIAPSGLADDSTFLRRVFLDTIGTLPTAVEARTFLADTRPDKRSRLIDQLLQRPEYADYWSMLWSDLLRVDRDAVTPVGAVATTRWLRRQFADNTPFDEFARSILMARGDIGTEGPAAIYKVIATPEDLSRSFSQLFLGTRIQCAQCHHHPADRWGQDDYFALAGFFTGVGRKTLPGGNEAIFVQKGKDLANPRTKKVIAARALGAAPADFSAVNDRRIPLARWMTASDNPFFARALANRLWSHYFGRGLVEPVDDMRATNPATNEPLLDELAKHLRDVKFDVKAFTRTLLNSRLYQLSGKPHPSSEGDEQNFAHAMPRALPAEVLLDGISQATGVPEKFNGFPSGYRAIQLWDNRVPSYFFRIFGRPVRASVCECERSNEPSIAQALHLMNSEEITAKLRNRTGTARRLAQSKWTPREIIDELYLGTLSRFPSAAERTLMLRYFAEAGEDRQGAVEDVLWALLNTRSFVYNH